MANDLSEIFESAHSAISTFKKDKTLLRYNKLIASSSNEMKSQYREHRRDLVDEINMIKVTLNDPSLASHTVQSLHYTLANARAELSLQDRAMIVLETLGNNARSFVSNVFQPSEFPSVLSTSTVNPEFYVDTEGNLRSKLEDDSSNLEP